ncbi:hypothetical protein [Pseudohoeflea coraliihabitans]|uniref:DUF1127 domain-containing protein n=1 Tax=Pseudohoeflea coraliihabitans TaxID=2860393 RepID=A0ABS6WIL3_9HYPH|nr:hypothetical protein [Pseudohoeflea sp. DP4N28-3]MBW3095777.1 hypothetical protein [Pseudohoeflea sp. DP4N28-3]
MSARNLFGQIGPRVITHWKQRRLERLMEGLSPEIRKDVGWPTAAATDGSIDPRHSYGFRR